MCVAGRQQVARIDVRSEDSCGTGFCIAPGRLLTALHVVARPSDPPVARGGLMIVPVDRDGHRLREAADRLEFAVEAFDLACDWIVLSFDPTRIRLEPLSLSPGVDGLVGRRWNSYGFPRDEPLGRALDGRLTSNNVAYPGTGASKGVVALQLTSDQAGFGQEIPGYSGAPVLVDDKVVGFIRSTPVNEAGKSVGGTIYAMPIASVVARLGLAGAVVRPANSRSARPPTRPVCFDRERYKSMFNAQFERRGTLPALVPISGDDTQLHAEFSEFCHHRITTGPHARELVKLPPIAWPAHDMHVDDRLAILRETLERSLHRSLYPDARHETPGRLEALFAAISARSHTDASGAFLQHRVHLPAAGDHQLLARYLGLWRSTGLEFAGTFEFLLPYPSLRNLFAVRRGARVIRDCVEVMKNFVADSGTIVEEIRLESPTLDEILAGTLEVQTRLPEHRVREIYQYTGGNMTALKYRIWEIIDG